MSRRCWRVGGEFAAVLVGVSCGGQAVHSEVDAEGVGGGSAGSMSTHESVVSTHTSETASTSQGGGTGGSLGGNAAFGGSSGSGGSDGFSGGAGVAGMPGVGGGEAIAVVTTSSTSGGSTQWGDAPVPLACVEMRSLYTDYSSCELVAECAGALISSQCWLQPDGASYSCECDGEDWRGRYDLRGVDQFNACSYAIAACLQVSAFETTSYECMRIYDNHDDPEQCNSDAGCEREAVFGGVKLAQSDFRQTRCSIDPAGWICECAGPVFGVNYLIPNVTSMSLCLDARDWCGGESLEVIGNRACIPTDISAEPDRCETWLTCGQAVLASGMEATRRESVPMECVRSTDGYYECSCMYLHRFFVAAPDSESACSNAASVCANG